MGNFPLFEKLITKSLKESPYGSRTDAVNIARETVDAETGRRKAPNTRLNVMTNSLLTACKDP